MKKLSRRQQIERVKQAQMARVVLADVPGTLRKVASERDYWRKEALSYRRKDEAEKVARAMHDKGLEQQVPFDVLVERMEKAAERGELRNIERAVDMIGPDMGSKIAQLANKDRYSESGTDALTNYLLGGIG